MRNALSLYFLLFSLWGCSKNPNSSTDLLGKVYYFYGEEALPGNLAPLNHNYQPLNLDPKNIALNSKTYSPLNILSQHLSLTLDAQTKKVTGRSVILFEMNQSSRPFLELQAITSSIKLDQQDIIGTIIPDPDGEGESYLAIEQVVDPGSIHEMEIIFEVADSKVSFTNEGASLLTSMTDLNGSFFEHWGPVGFEGDAFHLTLDLSIVHSTTPHQLITNGSMTQNSSHDWRIQFPDYFTKSSFYLHLTNSTDLVVKQFSYPGIEKKIPVLVYGSSAKLVDQAILILPELFKELENDYGPYPHASFTAYMHSGGGGMEYSGATITSLGSLDHELMHSWFARSIIPADGRSGWIDEAFASWRDYSYFQASTLLLRDATNLANYSPFRKTTPRNSYKDGRELIAELDREFAVFGGMKPLMKAFFTRYKNRVITNEEFWWFLESMTLMNIDNFFNQYTLGMSVNKGLMMSEELGELENDSKHPLPLSESEIHRLR